MALISNAFAQQFAHAASSSCGTECDLMNVHCICLWLGAFKNEVRAMEVAGSVCFSLFPATAVWPSDLQRNLSVNDCCRLRDGME